MSRIASFVTKYGKKSFSLAFQFNPYFAPVLWRPRCNVWRAWKDNSLYASTGRKFASSWSKVLAGPSWDKRATERAAQIVWAWSGRLWNPPLPNGARWRQRLHGERACWKGANRRYCREFFAPFLGTSGARRHSVVCWHKRHGDSRRSLW